jgi:hypothetical protein
MGGETARNGSKRIRVYIPRVVPNGIAETDKKAARSARMGADR